MDQLENEQLQRFITAALAEDVGDGDHTSLSTIPPHAVGEAQLIIKEPGILAGIAEALAVFHTVDDALLVSTYKADGDAVAVGDVVLTVKGNVHGILLAERLALNIMQRMSGIATATHRIVAAIAGTAAKVLDTRKTTPLLRFLEKKAVAIGGGVNHRFGLYDMMLIKDNHVDYAGGIKNAISRANAYRKNMKRPIAIEVEVRNREEIEEVLAVGGVERIMLDNFTPEALREAVALINGRLVTEASGGINIDNIRDYAAAGVDFISIGALTHSVKGLDMSLKANVVG
ncbi:carboxylating nicotinate-nucleotide diphosphorylase [Parapedobacter sp. 10938]|uniref:carboxylating nicotinate-nucleotide diphosphorylase n=1 Tax=Parapedobacter flavus TaxID=3110225 RepID=UPI002DBE4CAD|nr:carboxylating nicotinate-nucleotide diphosphorylase [Parapedobacter sp. 10938]MEC3880411.1 carboxylating nicotinate-nucleotide diphosphorylase [Parapedobacter sp. 10938]